MFDLPFSLWTLHKKSDRANERRQRGAAALNGDTQSIHRQFIIE